MAAKNHGISRELVIHPGETIAEVLESRNLKQNELAKRAGVSEAFLSDVIHGKKDISKSLAKGLEYALDVPSSFWLNLQANYDAELLAISEEESIVPDEEAILEDLQDMVCKLQKSNLIPHYSSVTQTIISLRKFFQISSLTNLYSLVPTGKFRISKAAAINQSVLGAWLCLCKVLGTKTHLSTTFEKDQTPQLISEIKEIMCHNEINPPQALKSLFSQYGIDFSVIPNFKGAPVHGYLVRKDDGTYQMVLTIRKAFADIFWFSLFHELGHIVNGDLEKSSNYIDTHHSTENNREEAANLFAAHALLNPEDYESFVAKSDFSIARIKSFANSQNVPCYIVIGRLQFDKLIPWNFFSDYKMKYKWAEE